jgi:hypothetical protein
VARSDRAAADASPSREEKSVAYEDGVLVPGQELLDLVSVDEDGEK